MLDYERIKRRKDVKERDERLLEEARWKLKVANYLRTPAGREYKERIKKRIIDLGGDV